MTANAVLTNWRVLPYRISYTTRSEHARWRFFEIHALAVQGLSVPRIASRLELDYKTVRRYLRAESVEQLIAGGVRTSKLDPFKPYLQQRLSTPLRLMPRHTRPAA